MAEKRIFHRIFNRESLRFTAAIFCVLAAVASWVAMAELIQKLVLLYRQPYFMTYLMHSSFVIVYVFWKMWREFPCNQHCKNIGDGHLTWKKALLLSAIFAVLYFIQAYFNCLSLTQTSIPANIAIYQSSIAITFILSVPILKERVTVVKVVCVLFSVSGVLLISVFSQDLPETHENTTLSSDSPTFTVSGEHVHQTALGYVFIVFSAVFNSLFEVLYKKFATAKDDPAALPNSLRMLGLMGIHTLLWMWPPIILLNYTVHSFQWPPLSVIKLLLISFAVVYSFDILFILTISLSSPTFTSLGIVMAIPVSVVVDYFIRHKVYMFVAYIGMFMIVVSFLGFSVSHCVESQRESQVETILHESRLGSVNSESSSGIESDASTSTIRKRDRQLKYNQWKAHLFKYWL